MKKIVCVLGSPRKGGNGETIAGRILAKAEANGYESQVFALGSLQYSGCIACMGCKKGADHCVVNDGLSPVLSAVREADVLLLASPIYFGQVTGQAKCFIDRTYSFLTPDYMINPNPTRLGPGKKVVFILTQGQPDPKFFADVFPNYERFFKWFGYESFLLRGLGLRDTSDAASRQELLAEADALADRIL